MFDGYMGVTINLPLHIEADMNNTSDLLKKIPEGGCPVREVMDRLGDKWTVLVILALASGTLRFSRLRDAIADISQRMLTRTLRHLERDGLVRREIFPEVPPRVEYSLTTTGQSFLGPLQQLVQWAGENQPVIIKARSAYDQRIDAVAAGPR